MKTAASSGSSSPSSISILADSASTMAWRWSYPAAIRATSAGAAARSASPTSSRTRTGFWVRNRKPRMAFSSSASSARSRIGEPASSPAWIRRTTASSRSAASRSAGLPCRRARLEPLDPAFGHRQVGEHELQVEALDVARRIDAAVGMRVGRILERADHVEQRVRVAQPGEVIGRQLLGPDMPLRRRRRRRQVDVGDVGVDDLLRLEDAGQRVEPGVGDLDHADVEGDPAVSAGLGVAAGQGVEDGRLARSGKPDDGDLHPPIVAGISTRRSGRPR